MRQLRDKRLYWRGQTIWCRVPGSTGRVVRKTTNCTDETAAAAVANRLERQYADPSHAAAAASTLEGSLKAYYADLVRRGRSAATLAIAKQKCGHFARIWGVGLPMIKIESALVLEYMDRRAREGAGAFTIKKELGHLSQVLRIARFLKVYHEDVANVIPPFLTGSPTAKTRAPSFDEVRRLLDEFPRWRAAHLAYIAATGARLGESVRARRVDVDFDKRLVTIRGTKTKGSAAAVAITAVSAPLLRWAVANAPGKDLLFRPWGKVWRDVAAGCVRAGIEKVTANDLRRAFGSWHRAALMLAGNTEKSAAELTSKMLRHSTDKLAQTTYANLDAAAVGAAIGNRLDGVSNMYALTAPSAHDGESTHEENSDIWAPPGEIESPAFGLGNRHQHARSTGTRIGLKRKRASSAVPELYPSESGDGETEPPARKPLAWVHEAEANLLALMAGVV